MYQPKKTFFIDTMVILDEQTYITRWFFEQDTLPLLPSTGWFHEPILA